MIIQRGDVVLVDWPFSGTGQTKLRPALVVQNNRDNSRVANTIVVMVTGQTKRALEATQLFIDVATVEGKQTGLHKDSVVNCLNLFTVEQSKVVRVIGHLAGGPMLQVDECLKAALELR